MFGGTARFFLEGNPVRALVNDEQLLSCKFIDDVESVVGKAPLPYRDPENFRNSQWFLQLLETLLRSVFSRCLTFVARKRNRVVASFVCVTAYAEPCEISS